MKTLLLATLMTFSQFTLAQAPVFKTANYQDYQTVETRLTQVAIAKIRPERIQDFKRVVNRLLTRLQAQEGNLGYTYSQNQEDPSEFIFHENWLNGRSIKKHMESELIQEFFGEVGSYFEPGFPQLIILEDQGEKNEN